MSEQVSAILSKISPLMLLPALIGGAVAAAYGGWFLYDMVVSSVGRGGYHYTLELPAAKPVKVQDAPFCAQKTMKWVGCY